MSDPTENLPDTPVTSPFLPLAQHDGPEPGDLELFGLQADADGIRRNRWRMFQTLQNEHEDQMLGEMSAAIYGDPESWLPGGLPPEGGDLDVSEFLAGPQSGPDLSPRERAINQLFSDAESHRVRMPGEMANVPATREDLRTQAGRAAVVELARDLFEAEDRIANRTDPSWTGGAASFAGSAYAAVTDLESIATLPFGFGSGTLARMVLVEGALGMGAAAVDLPSQYAQADRLGIEPPDPVEQILMGGVFGSLLPIGGATVKLGTNMLTKSGRATNADLLGFGRRSGATLEEQGATAVLGRQEATLDTAPDGILPEDHAGRVDAAEGGLDGDMMVRPGDVIPEIPAERTGQIPEFDYQPGGNAAPTPTLSAIPWAS
ncbi:hypothetical protein MASR1M32_10690 [Rhodobacter sp.]